MTNLGHIIAAVGSLLAGLFSASILSYTHVFPAPFVHGQARIIIGGDMMFDRSIRTTIDAKGADFIFSCIDPVLRNADLVMANLEGPITPNTSVSVGSAVGGSGNYTFTFAPLIAQLLHDHGITVVNLGNNHILNFQVPGLLSTESELSNAGVQYFGDPLGQSTATTVIHGVSITFINYNEFGLKTNAYRVATALDQIRAARNRGEVPIVYTHWGVEYVAADQNQKDLAHQFIDAGAEMVIGSHPHVVQESELYKGKHIYYSLGNFIFDQYWNDAVRSGLLLDITLDTAGVRVVREVPIQLSHDRCTRAA